MSGEIFKVRVPVRFAHCDPAGMTFFPRYFEIINGVVENWMDEGLGLSFAEMHLAQNTGVPTVKIDCKFIVPSRIGDVLEWSLGVIHIGRSSFVLHIVAYNVKSRMRVLETQHVLVYSSLEGEARSVEIPATLRQAMAHYLHPDGLPAAGDEPTGKS